jgi:hypothetical protein
VKSSETALTLDKTLANHGIGITWWNRQLEMEVETGADEILPKMVSVIDCRE